MGLNIFTYTHIWQIAHITSDLKILTLQRYLKIYQVYKSLAHPVFHKKELLLAGQNIQEYVNHPESLWCPAVPVHSALWGGFSFGGGGGCCFEFCFCLYLLSINISPLCQSHCNNQHREWPCYELGAKKTKCQRPWGGILRPRIRAATTERNLHRNKGWGVVGIQPQKSNH